MNQVSITGLIDYGKNGPTMDTNKSNLMRFNMRVRKPKNQVKEGSNEIYEFIDCVTFNKVSETLSKYVNQLDPITLHGTLSTYTQPLTIVDKQGQQKQINVKRTNVAVNRLDFLPISKDSNNNNNTQQNNNQSSQPVGAGAPAYDAGLGDDDLPF